MESEYKQLFVGGDLSGIQRFLYNITSSKAAVSLKGRSCYLSEYMKEVCDTLVEKVKAAGAQFTDVIYCSGGKFYFLTDNKESVVDAISKCAYDLKKELWLEQCGQLGLNVSCVAFTENSDGTVNVNGLLSVKCGELWRAVNAEFARQKNQKCIDFIIDEYSDMFEPIAVGQDKVCAITGIESDMCVKITSDDKEDIYVLPSVKQQIELGQKLRNEQDFKTFEEYAGNSKLGILRMDVDGLGKRFIQGFDSIKQYKVFSKRLVNFFEEETYKIQHEAEFRPYLNIIYAGGDDLFVVGRWDKVIEFAERIHVETENEFKEDGISISGGIVVVNSKFPIAKAAEMAGDAEDAAKHYDGGKKNAFHFLDKTVSWKQEFDYVKNYKNRFIALIDNPDGEPLSKGILHKIMLYSSIAENNKKRRLEGKAEDYSYVWHLSYYLTRYMKRYDKNSGVQKICGELRDKDILKDGGRALELIALGARWAELILKDKQKEKI